LAVRLSHRSRVRGREGAGGGLAALDAPQRAPVFRGRERSALGVAQPRAAAGRRRRTAALL